MQNSIDLKDIWQELLDFFADDPDVGRTKVNIWFMPIKPVSLENNVLKLEVPNTVHRRKIQLGFEKKISSFIKEMLCLDKEISIVYAIGGDEGSQDSGNSAYSQQERQNNEAIAAAQQKPSIDIQPAANAGISYAAGSVNGGFDNERHISAPGNENAVFERNINNEPWLPEYYRKQTSRNIEIKPNPTGLHPDFNPDYTFENFIIGPSNRFALGSAKLVVNESQSPFFIYSKPGLGKTHLLHAIAHGLYRKNPNVKIRYSAAESFVNEYIRNITSGHPEDFREKYRRLDCLLLDDVQFLLSKQRSIMEFFNTFNTLFDAGKLLVIASDRPPQEMALGDRLISRFEGGAIADITMPDYETRVAILKQKNEHLNYGIPVDVINFIAERVHKGGRELGGCLRTVKNFCIQTNARATVDVAQALLKNMFSSMDDGQAISIKTIMTVVAEQYSIEPRDLASSKRDQIYVTPRHIAMYLALKLTDMTKEKIGSCFGKNHSTVIAAEKKIEEEIKNPFFNETINKLIQKIRNVNNTEDI